MSTTNLEVAAKLRQLSEHLFVFDDTCNVYLVKDGEAGLLIDTGSGTVAEFVADAGVTSLEWVLHTHHHRDQCWGTPRVVAEYGARVAVPEHGGTCSSPPASTGRRNEFSTTTTTATPSSRRAKTSGRSGSRGLRRVPMEGA